MGISLAFETWLTDAMLWFFPDHFPQRSVLDNGATWNTVRPLYTFPALVLGGYLAATIAPHRKLAHVAALAILQELLIVVMMMGPPHPVPTWMWGVALVAAPISILLGGCLGTD